MHKSSLRTPGIVSILMMVLLTNSGAASANDDALIVSPISPVSSGQIHNGKLVWVDLVTTDTSKAVAFYSTVFGWQPQYFAGENYIELSHNDRVLSSVVAYEDGEAQDGDARWLVSISVEDVDATVTRAVANGGSVLESATDLPDRGRYAVLSDPQGAVLMLLRATGGDPDEDSLSLNEWGWAELWTDNPEAAVDFYETMVGYSSLRVPDTDGGERILLGTDGKARATIVQLPWDDVEPNWIPYIPVADTSATLRSITDAGGSVLVKSGDDQNAVSVAIAMDPTGGIFAIQQMGSDR
jgi:predicted enzyme related to lactoylglutathione lyase